MNARKRWMLAALAALLVLPAATASAGEGPEFLVCTLPSDVPQTLNQVFEQIGNLEIESKKECKSVCDAYGKACKDTVKNNARCLDHLYKPALRAAHELCNDKPCKNGVKEDRKDLRNELKDNVVFATDLCKEITSDCRNACKDFEPPA